MDRGLHVGNPHPQLPEIDLRLLTRGRLEPHGRARRPPARRPHRLQRPLDLLIAAREALRPELAVQDHPIPPDLGPPARQKQPIGVDRLGPRSRRPRPPLAPRTPTFDRLLVHAQLARDRLDALPAGQPCQHLAHDVFSQHPALHRRILSPLSSLRLSVDRPWSSPSEWRGA